MVRDFNLTVRTFFTVPLLIKYGEMNDTANPVNTF
jgi:hypothetical protein